MKLATGKTSAKACPVLFLVMVAMLLTVAGSAQPKQPVITLDPPTGWDSQIHNFDSQGQPQSEGPANFRRLGEAWAGETADLHTLTLRFSETVRITGITDTTDFRIEQGGSCVQGNIYEAKSTCTLLVRFTPQGPGRRVGRLTISHSGAGSPVPLLVTGYGHAPALSFIPALITTVPASYPSKKALLNNAHNLIVDGSDTLYVADTGNNVVRALDSGGNFVTISSGASAPWGVAVDSYSQVWYSQPRTNAIYRIAFDGSTSQASGTGTDNCFITSTCLLSNESVRNPGPISIDTSDRMAFSDQTYGAVEIVNGLSGNPFAPRIDRAYDPYAYNNDAPGPFALWADSSGGYFFYTASTTSGRCQIENAYLGDAQYNRGYYQKIAGGRSCGFAGDGGLAGNAEIGRSIGQFARDTAGNFYFTDTANQRVRRIAADPPVIDTVAGKGTAGYSGDGDEATLATLSNPTGVAVDSSGAVYVISDAAGSGAAQLIRKIGPQGYLHFANQFTQSASSPSIVKVTNTGNQDMTIANAVIIGTNASDFSIDAGSTSCDLKTGDTMLVPGEFCTVGVVFSPSGSGARVATLTLLGDTVHSNVVSLLGNGVARTAALKIASPSAGKTFNAGTAVSFSVKVMSSSGPAPTGAVQFMVDGVRYGKQVKISGGKASVSIAGLISASHNLSAVYSGDTLYASAGPISVKIEVKR